MKVLQTLGKHRATREGTFGYKRSSCGVTIQWYPPVTAGQTQTVACPLPVTLTPAEWNLILGAIERTSTRSFRITRCHGTAAPHESIYETVERAVRTPANGWRWDDSLLACVAAILEHEGSVDLYGGTLGRNPPAIIVLQRDIP